MLFYILKRTKDKAIQERIERELRAQTGGIKLTKHERKDEQRNLVHCC